MITKERRLEGRFLCADVAKMTWSNGNRSVDALLEDISPFGASVQVEEEIQTGTRIGLAIGGARFTGRVTYCIYRDYGFFAGIRFSDDTMWSSAQVVPQHLTDLRALAAA